MAFNQAKADAICDSLKTGESLRKAAESQSVAASTVLDWCKQNAEFAEQYARAREIGYMLLADEILEISDDSSGDVVQTESGPRADSEFIARSRLRVDSRKWMLSKMLPKVYGDKLELGGEITHKKAAADMTDDELTALAQGRKPQ